MISYETVFSRARNKYYDPKEWSLNPDDLLEINTERLHSAFGNVRMRNLFSSIILDDEVQELDFSLKHSVDEFSDNEFVIELLALSIVIEWLAPQVDSVKNTAHMIGGKEEKKILDNHKDMIDRLESLENKRNKIIRDYGYLHNSYIGGE